MQTIKRKTPSIRKKRANQQGASVIVVMVLMLALTMIGMSSIRTSTEDFTISHNKTYGFQASQVAKAGLQITLNHFRQNPSMLRILLTKSAQKSTSGPQNNLCDRAQTLCMTAASFFQVPKWGRMDHKAFPFDSLFMSPVQSTPLLYPDFKVRVHKPIKSTFTRALPGFSINSNKMCSYSVTFTSTGFVVNPFDVVQVPGARLRIIAEKVHQAEVQMVAAGDLCR